MPSGEAEPLSRHQIQAGYGDETADNGRDGQIRITELISRARQYHLLLTTYKPAYLHITGTTSSIKQTLNMGISIDAAATWRRRAI